MIDLSKYAEFVMAVTSKESRVAAEFLDRVKQIHYDKDNVINIPLLLTGLIGMTSEAGEAQEIMKKVLFQGRAYTDETRQHLIKELGDVIWYWTNACNALQVDPNEVIAGNVAKLEARYPGGTFDPYYSENRKEGDI
mgnify:CR=1 FL=1